LKVLLDECVPGGFAAALLPHEVITVRRAGLAGIKNGTLMALAENDFDAFVTVDKGIVFQHPTGRYALRIVCFRPISNKVEDMFPHAPSVLFALEQMKVGEVRLLDRIVRDQRS
jgi:hypothetical protein